MSAPDNLTPKQERLLLALLIEPTHEAAAAKAGISPATLRRWLRQPEFIRAYRVARRQLVETAIGKLQQASSEAVDTLRDALTSDHPGTRVKAAVAILDRAYHGTEMLDLVAQVEQQGAAIQALLEDDATSGGRGNGSASPSRNGRAG